MSQLVAFLGVAVLVIVTPGPDTALTIRNTLLGGRPAGIATALGVVSGQAVWALATSVGLVALLLASEPAFAAVRIAGAAYLIYLGVQALVAAFRPAGNDRVVAEPRRDLPARTAVRQGLISNLGNPKMAAFFPSLLPQFVPAGDPTFLPLLLLGLVFCSLTFVWLSAYAVVVARAGDLLRRSRVRRAMEAVTGAVLVALGLRLAAEQR
ncbi:MAG TPA: LysE family translocator [Gaiellaceae bacterium]|nr:LysE family translocator [Gaiellaceae bacterium]